MVLCVKCGYRGQLRCSARSSRVMAWVYCRSLLHTWRAGAYGRYGLPVAEGWLVPYVQGGGGPAMALATYTDERCEQQRRFMGWHLAGAAGLQLMPSVAGHRHLGIYAQVETSYAPVLDNLMGDVHDSGRRAIMLGIRAGY